MKTKLIFLACLFFLSGQLIKAENCSPENLSGAWFGYITQGPFGLADRYIFQLHFDQAEADGELKGMSYIAMETDDSYGIMNLKCEIQDGKLNITELEIVEEKLMIYAAYWCMKSYQLQLREENGTQILEGDWESEFCGLTSGSIHLERQNS